MKNLDHHVSAVSRWSNISKHIQILYANKHQREFTCFSSLDMCWLSEVQTAPVQEASSLRKLSFWTSEFISSNNWQKRPLSPWCSREYVVATFLTRLSRAGKITCWHEKQKNLWLVYSKLTIWRRRVLFLIIQND